MVLSNAGANTISKKNAKTIASPESIPKRCRLVMLALRKIEKPTTSIALVHSMARPV